ncbi:hypothetical protein JQC67_02145 [Aurantibacter crassamenti]|uniref:hypothetical protein n=1 Tax=Aurantibacter crassamenti TaxID=1837375 RepID=UPI00193A4960|nr:hypothetical protein [Aurantibacter crassamenti]MBM1104929.1 hypothetical protein [Aurantibacter crassamenti]
MNIKTAFTLCFTLLFIGTSCSHRLIGTWNVKNYERITPGSQGMSVQNIGTISFNKNGTGTKKLDYALLGFSSIDQTPFNWSSTKNYLTIEDENSEFSKTWIFIENKNKIQKWQSTDGNNQVQTLVLKKE